MHDEHINICHCFVCSYTTPLPPAALGLQQYLSPILVSFPHHLRDLLPALFGESFIIHGNSLFPFVSRLILILILIIFNKFDIAWIVNAYKVVHHCQPRHEACLKPQIIFLSNYQNFEAPFKYSKGALDHIAELSMPVIKKLLIILGSKSDMSD